MKSFSRQLCDLFSYAGYKTNGKLLPCSVAYSPYKTHQKLTYKCDVALRLYDYYKKHGFKYSESGVTPKSIAEQIEIFVRQSKDYRLTIDSFGCFNVSPTEEYLSRLERQIEITNKIEHREIVVDGLRSEEWHSKNKKVIFIPTESFTLTSLRVAYYLSLLKKKCQVFKEYKPQQIVSFFKSQNLGFGDLKFLMKLGIISPALKTCKYWNDTKLYIEAEGKKPQLLIEDNDEVISGTVRHNYIPFLSENQQYIGEKANVKTFGDILPNSNVNQILLTNRDIIPKILLHSLKFGIQIPISFKEEDQQPYNPQGLLQQLKGRNNKEILLILLDYLNDDKLIDIFALKNSDFAKNEYQPYKALFGQLDMIV